MKKELIKDIIIIALLMIVILLVLYLSFQKQGAKMYEQGFNAGVIQTASEQTKTGFILTFQNNTLQNIHISEICSENLKTDSP